MRSPQNASEADIKVWRALRHTEMRIGTGETFINMSIIDGHIMIRIITELPIDQEFIVHGCLREKPSSQQSRCWHISQDLERDCDELLLRMRKPLSYGRIDCPDGYYSTSTRRCPSCPSLYTAWVWRGEKVRRGDQGECYPYSLQFTRWIDLGEWQKEEESEEFTALTAGQVCCDSLKRKGEPPTDCLWQGRDWSTILSIGKRAERLG